MSLTPIITSSRSNPTPKPSSHHLKRKRTTTKPNFKPPSRLTTTLPRFLAHCPHAVGDTFIVKVVNILLISSSKRLIPGELWVQYTVTAEDTPLKTATTPGKWVVGTIIDPATRFWKAVHNHANTYHADVVVDGCGSIVCAGFVDLQLNGAFGIDFTSNAITEAQVHTVAEGLTQHGVTSFLPTIITSPSSTYHHAIPTIAAAGKSRWTKGANILGLHLEGPFIHPMKKGAHSVNHITPPVEGMKTVRHIYGHLEMVRIVTLAPELSGSLSAIAGLTTMGVAVSVGHTTTSLSTALSAVSHGARLVTHLFNAMSAFHHRDPGLVGILTHA